MHRDYPHKDTKAIAADLKRTTLSVYQHAQAMGLRKSEAYNTRKRALEKERLLKNGVAHRFPKGHVPHNMGMRRPGWAPGRMRETQFRKGQLNGKAAQHYMPIGSHRINADGYLDRKVRDDGPPQKRWVSVHRLIWIQANGPIPPGHAVGFKPGRRTTVLEQITLDSLELLSRKELMRRNSYHYNYPKEIGRLIQLQGALKRQIRRRERLAHEKQD